MVVGYIVYSYGNGCSPVLVIMQISVFLFLLITHASLFVTWLEAAYSGCLHSGYNLCDFFYLFLLVCGNIFLGFVFYNWVLLSKWRLVQGFRSNRNSGRLCHVVRRRYLTCECLVQQFKRKDHLNSKIIAENLKNQNL